MKIIFLDIDGVVSTFEYKWRLDINKLLLLNNIIYETNAKIVISSSWRHGCKTIEELKNHFRTFRLPSILKNKIDDMFLQYIVGMTPIGENRGEEIKQYLETHNDIESYVILDDDSDMLKEQLFNFVQTDGFEGLTTREVKLCISILKGEKIINPIRLNYKLRNEWINNCIGLQNIDINERIQEYENNKNMLKLNYI